MFIIIVVYITVMLSSVMSLLYVAPILITILYMLSPLEFTLHFYPGKGCVALPTSRWNFWDTVNHWHSKIHKHSVSTFGSLQSAVRAAWTPFCHMWQVFKSKALVETKHLTDLNFSQSTIWLRLVVVAVVTNPWTDYCSWYFSSDKLSFRKPNLISKIIWILRQRNSFSVERGGRGFNICFVLTFIKNQAQLFLSQGVRLCHRVLMENSGGVIPYKGMFA